MIQLYISGRKMYAAMIALVEVLHGALLPFAVQQMMRPHERFINAHFLGVDIRPESLFPLCAEKVSHLLLHQDFQFFLCPTAEKGRAENAAKKQHCHKERFECLILQHKIENGTAHCANHSHPEPDDGHCLIMSQLF